MIDRGDYIFSSEGFAIMEFDPLANGKYPFLGTRFGFKTGGEGAFQLTLGIDFSEVVVDAAQRAPVADAVGPALEDLLEVTRENASRTVKVSERAERPEPITCKTSPWVMYPGVPYPVEAGFNLGSNRARLVWAFALPSTCSATIGP